MNTSFIQTRSMKSFLILLILISATFFPHFSFISAQDCTSNNPPFKPSNPFPLSGHNDVARNVTLSWNCTDPDDEDLVYDVYFDTKIPIRKQLSKQTNMTFDPGLLRYNTRYYWMVVVYDPCDQIAISNFWSFVTEQNPNPHPPEIQEMFPSMNAKEIDIPATLSVMVFDEDNDLLKITFYDANENTVIGQVETTSGKPISLLWDDLKTNEEYDWYVTVSDPEFTITSETRSFKTYNHSAFPVAQFDFSPHHPKQYQLVTFNATESYDPDGSILEYRWDLMGNGTFTSWQNNELITHTYSTEGTYQVTLQVKDDELINTSTQTIHITNNSNHPPNTPQKPTGPNNGFTQTTYTFSTTTTDEDEDNVKYGWDWNNDGIVDTWTEYKTQGTTTQIQHIWDNPGTYTISVKAQDEHGLTSDFSESTTITINTTTSNEKNCYDPPANPSPSHNANDVSLTGVYLEWECSDSDEDDIVYTVYFDNSPEFDEPVEENIETTQYYPGQLQKETTYYWKIIVYDKTDGCLNESPIWQFTTTNVICPSDPKRPLPSNGETNVDPCSTILSWESDPSHEDDLFFTVYFGESKDSLTVISTRTQNTQINPGILKYETTYHWYVQVTDDICSPLDGMKWSFTTTSKPCSASIQGPSETNSGVKVTFSASESRCESGTISSYQWDFGDGTTATGETVTHIFRGNETFTVRLSIRCKPDCIDCSDTITHKIHVGNSPPNKPTLTNNEILPFIGGQAQGPYSFTVKGNDPDGDPIRFRFEWGDNSSNTVTDYVSANEEVTISHVWMETGDYTVRIYTEDEHGGRSTPLRFSVKMGSATHIAMIIIATLGIVIASVQVFFVVIGHRKKMFQ